MPKGVYERTKENIEKMRKALTGRTIPEKARRNMSIAQKGKSVLEKGHKSNCQCCCCKAKREETKGENNPNWKGGQKTDDCGYIRILMPMHPRADKSGYTRRAHLVAEQKLGRYLYPNEITHHKNGIRDDDRPENIEVTTQKKHTSLHNKIRKKLKEAQLCQT